MPAEDAPQLASRIARALPQARWFADKGAAIEGVTIHDRIGPSGRPDAGPALVLADVCGAGGGGPHRYCLLVGPSADGNVDVAGTAGSLDWLVDAMLSGARIPGGAGTLVGHRVGGPAVPRPGVATAVTPAGADASNSSFVVESAGCGLVVKLFRRCREGVHPEVEVGEFLATAAAWADSPRLLGWLEYAAADGRSSTALATVHEFSAGCVTAWDRLVGLLVAAGPEASLPADVERIVARIGTVTGRMHRALASRPDLPAFAPAVPTPAGRRAVAGRMAAHAAEVFALVASRLPHVPPPLDRRLRGLLDARGDLLGRFTPLESLATDVPDVRVHGDYHLGQVLVGARDERVLVIDFEGEPGRTLEERRAKASAAKDVAGMCRSFDYLSRHAAGLTGRRPRADDVRRLEAVFLDAYRAAAGDGAWWPADESVAATLLDVHRLDKALYELAYEINNRPDWVEVPLAALEEIAARPAPSRV